MHSGQKIGGWYKTLLLKMRRLLPLPLLSRRQLWKFQFLLWPGFVAQFGLSLDFPLPQTDLAYSHCLGNAKSSEAI